MIQQKINIINKLGLHARAAAKLVACTGCFVSQIQIKKGEKSANGKSIMGVMMLAALPLLMLMRRTHFTRQGPSADH